MTSKGRNAVYPSDGQICYAINFNVLVLLYVKSCKRALSFTRFNDTNAFRKLEKYFSPHLGVASGNSKNVGLGKFWQDLEISEAFLISLEVSFFHGLFLLFLSLETFLQRVSGSDF